MATEFRPPRGKKVESILRAARDLFSIKGFENTPVSEIASAAKVADGTVIYYFKTKENLLFILTRQIFYELYKTTREASIKESLPALDAMDAFIDAHADFILTHRNEYMVLLKADPFRILRKDLPDYQDAHLYSSLQIDLIMDMLNRGIAQGDFPELPVKDTAHVIYSMVLCAGRLLATMEPVSLGLYDEIKRFIHIRLSKL